MLPIQFTNFLIGHPYPTLDLSSSSHLQDIAAMSPFSMERSNISRDIISGSWNPVTSPESQHNETHPHPINPHPSLQWLVYTPSDFSSPNGPPRLATSPRQPKPISSIKPQKNVVIGDSQVVLIRLL